MAIQCQLNTNTYSYAIFTVLHMSKAFAMITPKKPIPIYMDNENKEEKSIMNSWNNSSQPFQHFSG